MKVLFFSRRFWPDIGGVEKHVLKLSEELKKRGHDIIIVAEKEINQNNNKLSKSDLEFNISGIKVFKIPITTSEKNKKFQIWFWLLKNIRLIKSADIIHCHDVFYWYLPFLFLFPRKKIFTTFHGYEGSEPNMKQIMWHKLAGLVSRGTIAIGKFHQKWYKVKSNLISYGAIDNSKILIGRNSDIEYDFCFIGRLEVNTGIMVYLQALKNIKEKLNRNLSLIVCGNGSQIKKAKEFCKVNKLKVKFLGFVNNPEKYLVKAKFAFVSGYLGILESLINQKLVFAVYNDKIKKDYLKMTPFSKYISISSDSEELSKHIMFYMQRPNLTKVMIKKGYDWAQKQTWSKLTNQYIKLWTK